MTRQYFRYNQQPEETTYYDPKINRCWQCFKLGHPVCPNPDIAAWNNIACPHFQRDTRPHCIRCHATGGTIQPIPHKKTTKKGKKIYHYARWVHYDPTKKSKRRTCYLGRIDKLPLNLQRKLAEQRKQLLRRQLNA